MKTQYSFKSDDTILSYFPNGNIVFDDLGRLKLIEKPAQSSDTCWFDGPMMLANLLIRELNFSGLTSIKSHKDETGALFLLEYCYSNFISQFNKEKLTQLANHSNILSINFPQDFTKRLRIAINSQERKNLLIKYLLIAAEKGKEEANQSFTALINKMRFVSAQKCLNSIGMENIANNIAQTNSNLSNKDKYCQLILIMQKDSILEWLFNCLTITKCSFPTKPQELYELLNEHGPLLIKGHFGIDSYTPDSAKVLSTTENINILGWNKTAYKEEKLALHATIIVGVKYNTNSPELSRIYFLDPRQTLNPQQQKQVYSVAFSKYKSTVQDAYFLSDYNLTAENVKSIEENKPSSSGFKKGLLANSFLASAPKKETH